MRAPAYLPSRSFKCTGTLIFVFAVTGTGASATGFFILPKIFHTN